MSRDEANGLRKIAKELLLAAGVDLVEASEFYAIVNGGADEIVGMIVSDGQLEKWRGLGGQGELVYSELLLHADDEQKAYGGHCYGLETVTLIRDAVSDSGIRIGVDADPVEFGAALYSQGIL